MNSKKIEVWMIGISHSEVSRMYMKHTISSWNEYNLFLFPAVTPRDLNKFSSLSFLYTGPKKRQFTSTEKAVWYSHYLLWKKCWEEKKPLIIIEHDSILRKDIGEIGRTKLLSYLTDRKPIPNDPIENGNILSPGSGYSVFPDDIIQLINYSESKPITSNVDGYVREYIQNKYGWPEDFSYIEQVKINNLSTIVHRKENDNIRVPE